MSKARSGSTKAHKQTVAVDAVGHKRTITHVCFGTSRQRRLDRSTEARETLGVAS